MIFKDFALSDHAALSERVVIKPRLADTIEKDNLVSLKGPIEQSFSDISVFAKSIAFDARFRGFSLSILDGTIIDVASVTDSTNVVDGAELLKLNPGERFAQIDLFEGTSGLAIKVSKLRNPERLANYF